MCRQESYLRDVLIEKMEYGAIDYVTFTSASTVRGFVEVMKGMDFSKVKALCIGEQTAREAEKYKMEIEISDRATIDGMVAKLKALCKK